MPGFLKTIFSYTASISAGRWNTWWKRSIGPEETAGLSHLPEIDNDFMRGLQLVIDGTDPELTRNMLEMEIASYEQGQNLGVEIFNSAGGFAPTMGIVGTVMGLVHVLGNISDPDALAPAVASAFIATLYGIATANLLWIPFATKIKTKASRQISHMELILEGILSVQAGENPRVIREKLLTFLPEREKEELLVDEAAGMGM